MNNPERDSQKAVVKWLKLVLPVGSLVAAAVNEAAAGSVDGNARARFYASRKAAGVLAGFPDLSILLPQGRVIFIEMKAPGGKGVVSLAQQDIHRRLWAIGHATGVTEDIESVRYILRSHGVVLREADGQPARLAKFRLEKPTGFQDDAVPF